MAHRPVKTRVFAGSFCPPPQSHFFFNWTPQLQFPACWAVLGDVNYLIYLLNPLSSWNYSTFPYHTSRNVSAVERNRHVVPNALQSPCLPPSPLQTKVRAFSGFLNDKRAFKNIFTGIFYTLCSISL